MLRIETGRVTTNCQGVSRRGAIKAGALTVAGLTLADTFRNKAVASTVPQDKSVILVWLDGGPSHLESYDPKPEAPAEYRGPFQAIATNTPGIQFSENLAGQAKIADKMAVVRSLHHDTGDHFAAGHWMLTGRFGSNSANKEQVYPSVGSTIARACGSRQSGIPPYVGLPAAQSIYLYPGYQGAAYLGSTYDPFDVQPDQKYLGHSYGAEIKRPACLDNFTITDSGRFESRLSLLDRLDGVRRQLDRGGMMDSMDRYQQQAVDLMLSGEARNAFDMEQEDAKVRERYGPGPWGHYTCMARRLVSSGVRFVTVDMPHWDHHSNIEKGHGSSMRAMDRAVTALIEDLDERGMLDEVLVLVMGEFSRTPRLNSGQPGVPVPGRDHWGNAISAMMAGGGVRGGQVVGATSHKGEYPVERPLKPGDLLATVYHLLGIDPELSFQDHAGRPTPIIDEGQAIREIV